MTPNAQLERPAATDHSKGKKPLAGGAARAGLGGTEPSEDGMAKLGPIEDRIAT